MELSFCDIFSSNTNHKEGATLMTLKSILMVHRSYFAIIPFLIALATEVTAAGLCSHFFLNQSPRFGYDSSPAETEIGDVVYYEKELNGGKGNPIPFSGYILVTNVNRRTSKGPEAPNGEPNYEAIQDSSRASQKLDTSSGELVLVTHAIMAHGKTLDPHSHVVEIPIVNNIRKWVPLGTISDLLNDPKVGGLPSPIIQSAVARIVNKKSPY